MTDRTDDEITALCEAATPGPWEIYRYRNGGGRIHIAGDHGRKRDLIADMEPDGDVTAYSEGDREFLFAARTLVPSLLARAQKAEAEAEDLRRQLLDETYRPEGGEIVMRELSRVRDEARRAVLDVEKLRAERDALAARAQAIRESRACLGAADHDYESFVDDVDAALAKGRCDGCSEPNRCGCKRGEEFRRGSPVESPESQP